MRGRFTSTRLDVYAVQRGREPCIAYLRFSVLKRVTHRPSHERNAPRLACGHEPCMRLKPVRHHQLLECQGAAGSHASRQCLGTILADFAAGEAESQSSASCSQQRWPRAPSRPRRRCCCRLASVLLVSRWQQLLPVLVGQLIERAHRFGVHYFRTLAS